MRTPVTDRLVRAYWTGARPVGERLEEWTPSARRRRPGGDDRGNAHLGAGARPGSSRHSEMDAGGVPALLDLVRLRRGDRGSHRAGPCRRPLHSDQPQALMLTLSHFQGGTARWGLAEAEALLQ